MDSILVAICSVVIGVNVHCADLYQLPPMYQFNRVENTFGGRLSGACEGLACKKLNNITSL